MTGIRPRPSVYLSVKLPRCFVIGPLLESAMPPYILFPLGMVPESYGISSRCLSATLDGLSLGITPTSFVLQTTARVILACIYTCRIHLALNSASHRLHCLTPGGDRLHVWLQYNKNVGNFIELSNSLRNRCRLICPCGQHECSFYHNTDNFILQFFTTTCLVVCRLRYFTSF
jgi:hypothetical protein